MTLLQLQDLPTVIRTLLKQSYIRSIIILNPGNFTVLLGSQEQENPLSYPYWLV